LTHPQRVILP